MDTKTAAMDVGVSASHPMLFLIFVFTLLSNTNGAK